MDFSCPNWVANGFCTKPGYSLEDKKKYCAKSCGVCSSSTNTGGCTDYSTEYVIRGCPNMHNETSFFFEIKYETISPQIRLSSRFILSLTKVFRCAIWAKNSFCTNTNYPDGTQAYYCKATCNLC